jgi:SAM-dependent methyltransferase
VEPLPPNAYGDAFADVYDRWYADITDAEATAAFVAKRCVDGLPLLELGVGSGRLVGALVAAELAVIGVDASSAMLALCREAHPDTPLLQADLARFAPAPPVGAALCAFNTLFNLTDPKSQQALMSAVANALAPGGALIIEAVTGHSLANAPETSTGPSAVDPDKTVTSTTQVDAKLQTISGVHAEYMDSGEVKERAWQLRWSTPQQLDGMAEAAGLVLSERYEAWDETPFSRQSDTHVSVYRRTPDL